MNALHTQLGIHSHKLDKLLRRVNNTDREHTELLVAGTWLDYSVVEKSLDIYLKASDEYWGEFNRVRVVQ